MKKKIDIKIDKKKQTNIPTKAKPNRINTGIIQLINSRKKKWKYEQNLDAQNKQIREIIYM